MANNPLDLLCIDVTSMDPSKDRKEHILVMTDTFSNFSVTVVTPNQQMIKSCQSPYRKKVLYLCNTF